jgi:E3 ubiquitin-protein ligase AIP2
MAHRPPGRCPNPNHPGRLPTDDHAYEARKERAAAEEEDRRGAAAALSHNEFMYT